MEMIEAVRTFMRAAEQPNNAAQVEKQIGFVTEELAEAFLAIGMDRAGASLGNLADALKYGKFRPYVEDGDKVELLDAFLDIAWVAIGGAIALGADVEGAWNEVRRSNLSKIDPATGKMVKDANGKVVKPAGYSAPDLTKYVEAA